MVGSNEDLEKVVNDLRMEVQQLREIVNMLLELVVEYEEEDIDTINPIEEYYRSKDRFSMCM